MEGAGGPQAMTASLACFSPFLRRGRHEVQAMRISARIEAVRPSLG